MSKLPVRVREALDKGGWSELEGTRDVVRYRADTAEIYIHPSNTHPDRYAIVIRFDDEDRETINDGVNGETLIKYLTNVSGK